MKSKTRLSVMALLAFGIWAACWASDIYVTPNGEMTAKQKEMVSALNSDKAEVRAKAAEKLGVQCCKQAVDLLVQMMKTDDVASLRIIAANALWKIGESRAVAEIKEQAQVDKNKTVRTTLAAIADKFEKGEKAG